MFSLCKFPCHYSDIYIVFSVLGDINSSRVLLSMGDNISSEIISPSGSMGRNSTSAHVSLAVQYFSRSWLA